MRIPLKKIRDAASRAAEVARTGPADTLKQVTERMLDSGPSSGLPPDAATAGSATAARLWTKVAPQDPMAQARLAEALVRDGRLGEALESVTLPGDDRSNAALLAQAWLARAEGATAQGNAALARLQRLAAQLGSDDSPLAHEGRAVAATAALDCCATDLALSLLGPTDHHPLHAIARGRLALVEGRLEEARSILSPAPVGESDEGRLWHAVALALSGETQQARFILELLRPRGPAGPWVHYVQGWLQALSHDAESAETSLELSVEGLANPAGAWFLLGLLAENEGRLHEARQAYRKATRHGADWAPPWLGLVRTALATGHHEEAQQAALHAGVEQENSLLAGLALALAGEGAQAESRWMPKRHEHNKELQRDVSTLRAAVAWHLTSQGRHQDGAAAWKTVADRASHAGSTRLTLARWALDGAHRCLGGPHPPYYTIEAALATASALRPDQENLVVAHCAATMLARGPAAARTALQAALTRGATDDRITGLRALLDSVTTGADVPVLAVGEDGDISKAAASAREGDSAACRARVDELVQRHLSPIGKTVVNGAQALLGLTEVGQRLQEGDIDGAVTLLKVALEHLPQGAERDRVIHELAACSALAARRGDRVTAQEGEAPPKESLVWWQEALSYWAALSQSEAYWAGLTRKVLELDDPRLTSADVDALRKQLPELALAHPADYGAEALGAGQARRARAFVALIIGAPFDEHLRHEALARALAPLAREVHQVADEAGTAATELPPGSLLDAYNSTYNKVEALRITLEQAAPDHVPPVATARDELATAMHAFFENLHDRARERNVAWSALRYATELAGTETFRAELEAKRRRLGRKK